LIIRAAPGYLAHPPGEFALMREQGAGPNRLLRIIPDVVGPSQTVVIDLKWKFVDVSSLDVDVEDLHQILTYARHFGAIDAVLLFPTLSSDSPGFRYRAVGGPRQSVRIAFVPVTGEYTALRSAVIDAIKPPEPVK